MPGEPLLNDRYRLLRALGSGGAGHTWLAEDTTTGAHVTVKELHDPVNGSEVSLVEREARLLGQIHHPQVPRFVDAFVEEVRLVRRLHLVLEFVEGESLDREFAQRRLSQNEAIAVLQDILGVVSALHELAPPVIHRDLKPSNIIRRPDGRVVLIDFGLAIDAVDRTFQHTMAAGTLGYQAPEQIAGDPRPASDVYSVGVLALVLLTRAEPHTLLEWQTLRWEGAAQHLDPALRGWLERALDPSPDTRFLTATEALRALRSRSELRVGEASPTASPVPKRAVPPSAVAKRPGPGGVTLLLAVVSVLTAAGVAALLALSLPAPESASAPAQPIITTSAQPETSEPVAAETLPSFRAAACRAGSGADCLAAGLELLDAPSGEDPREADRRLAFDLLAIGCMGTHQECCVVLADRVATRDGRQAAMRWWNAACQLGHSDSCKLVNPSAPTAPAP